MRTAPTKVGRPGTTLAEIAVALALLAIVAGFAMPGFQSWRDRIAAEAAASSTAALLASARHAAIRRAVVTAVRVDTAAATIIVYAGPDTIQRRPLGLVHGVSLGTTRDSIAYGPGGMGYGAANAQIVVRRGAAAETVTVSRLGRVRR